MLVHYEILIYFLPLLGGALAQGQVVIDPGLMPARQPIQNILGGVYSNNITLFFRNSPYRVTSDLTVEFGATLTIETGVQIYFDTGVGLKVKGTLRAIVSCYFL
ncbi:unnamed protein product [Strongylus vulgaris]|uniref:Lipid-binding serum glycoprotein N-terminal domain-containing protein n=1 Tax=Strongylus vulgaris TaxID=40348 RepID=A0A3P7IWY8_STRVU|nr:unnamed protein product [Strongylus vulgaris]